MGYGTTIVKYDGSNLGDIYLRDIGQRNQLGGGKGIYTLGQDRYMSYGGDATFVSTSDVMLSATNGVIKAMETAGAFTVTKVADS